MKKKLIVGIICMVFCFISYYGYNQLNPVTVEMGAEKKIVVENLSELKAEAELIVSCKVSGDSKEVVRTDAEGTPINGYTLIPIKIQKTYKGNDLVDDKDIIVYEPTFEYNVPVTGEKYIMTVDGYVKMNNKDKYILFLTKVEGTDYYVCTSAADGKYLAKKSLKDIGKEHLSQETLQISKKDSNYEKLLLEVITEYSEEYK